MDTGRTTPARAELRTADEPVRQRNAESEGVGSLIAGIVEDLQEVIRGEVTLARTEIKEDISSAGKGAATTAAGGLIAYVGFALLMLAVAFLINKWLSLWLATGIVAVALLVIGLIAALIGKQRLSAANLKPEETIASLKEDQQWANRQINSVKQ